jgi:hypothetical protein
LRPSPPGRVSTPRGGSHFFEPDSGRPSQFGRAPAGRFSEARRFGAVFEAADQPFSFGAEFANRSIQFALEFFAAARLALSKLRIELLVFLGRGPPFFLQGGPKRFLLVNQRLESFQVLTGLQVLWLGPLTGGVQYPGGNIHPARDFKTG